jgi:hypothetical protein
MKTRERKALRAIIAGMLGALCLFPLAAVAQTPFYLGKTITLVQSSDAGDTSDTMVRAALPTLKKHIPGEPTIKLQFMPGGGGTKAANYIFNNARPDGLTIGRIGGGLVANSVLSAPGVSYDLNKLIYLGSAHSTFTGFLSPGRRTEKPGSVRSTPGLRIGSQGWPLNYFVGRLFAWLMATNRASSAIPATSKSRAGARRVDARINNADTRPITPIDDKGRSMSTLSWRCWLKQAGFGLCRKSRFR